MAIVFEHKGTQYTLEYTRDSVRKMENAGFTLDRAGDTPVNTILVLFRGAFMAHHPRTSQTVIDEIWSQLGNKDDIFEALATLYQEPIEALMKEPDEGEAIVWRVK